MLRNGPRTQLVTTFTALTLAWQVRPAGAGRPLATEDAGVAAAQVTQAEVSWDRSVWAAANSEHIIVAALSRGIGTRLEVGAEIPCIVRSAAGAGGTAALADVVLCGKLALCKGTSTWPAAAVRVAVKTPTGRSAAGAGSGDTDWSFTLATTQSLGCVSAHLMLGHSIVGRRVHPELSNQQWAGIGVDVAATPSLHVVSEVVRGTAPERTMSTGTGVALAGVTLQAAPQVAFDAGVRRGLTPTMPPWSFTLGSTLQF